MVLSLSKYVTVRQSNLSLQTHTIHSTAACVGTFLGSAQHAVDGCGHSVLLFCKRQALHSGVQHEHVFFRLSCVSSSQSPRPATTDVELMCLSHDVDQHS